MSLKFTYILSKLSGNHKNCLEFRIRKFFSGRNSYHRCCLEFLAQGDYEEQNNFSVHFQYCCISLLDNRLLTACTHHNM